MDLREILTTCACVVILLVIYYAGTFQRRKQEKDLKKMQCKSVSRQVKNLNRKMGSSWNR